MSQQKPRLENACRLRSQLAAGERRCRLRAQICEFHKSGAHTLGGGSLTRTLDGGDGGGRSLRKLHWPPASWQAPLSRSPGPVLANKGDVISQEKLNRQTPGYCDPRTPKSFPSPWQLETFLYLHHVFLRLLIWYLTTVRRLSPLIGLRTGFSHKYPKAGEPQGGNPRESSKQAAGSASQKIPTLSWPLCEDCIAGLLRASCPSQLLINYCLQRASPSFTQLLSFLSLTDLCKSSPLCPRAVHQGQRSITAASRDRGASQGPAYTALALPSPFLGLDLGQGPARNPGRSVEWGTVTDHSCGLSHCS